MFALSQFLSISISTNSSFPSADFLNNLEYLISLIAREAVLTLTCSISAYSRCSVMNFFSKSSKESICCSSLKFQWYNSVYAMYSGKFVRTSNSDSLFATIGSFTLISIFWKVVSSSIRPSFSILAIASMLINRCGLKHLSIKNSVRCFTCAFLLALFAKNWNERVIISFSIFSFYMMLFMQSNIEKTRY